VEPALISIKHYVDLLVQGVVLVVPIVATWFARTYVRGETGEKRLAAIARLSSSAIDYVENLDRRGELSTPLEQGKGPHKLKLAGEWLSAELRRAGISMNEKTAATWIASKYQERVGEVRPVGTLLEVARAAGDLIQRLDPSWSTEVAAGGDRPGRVAELAADWMIARVAERGVVISRDEALTWVRAELAQRLQTRLAEAPAAGRLSRLARAAVEFLDGLKASGQLTVHPGAAGHDVETDLAAAWLLTEAAKQGLPVTADQIAEAIGAALRERAPTP